MRFSVVVPQYLNRLVFADVSELLGHGLRELGHNVESTTEPATGTRAIILAPHLLRAAGAADTVRDGDIVYNFEPVESSLFHASLPLLTRPRVHVWDYSQQGRSRLRELGVHALCVPLGYHEAMSRLRRIEPAEIDVLFYGSMNARRQIVLTELELRGLRVRNLFGWYGRDRDELIEKSKCVLNMHFYESAPTEDVRLFYLLSNRVPVVSEGPPDERRKANWCVWADFKSLADICQGMCALADSQRENIGRLGFELFSRGAKEKDILSVALEASR